MSQSDETWNEVGDGFKKLGSMFKQHYESQAGKDDSESVSEEEVKDAIRTIGENLKTAFATVGDAAKDPEVQAEVKQTAKSFIDALGATFADLGDEISKWREKSKSEEQPAPAEEAAAETPEPPDGE
ncbi:MAG TPA: hypothetical protein VLT15_06850 [Acidimicrobiia bacterium]|nr:hypothetical protein [Acidimicrobiia bacterium]